MGLQPHAGGTGNISEPVKARFVWDDLYAQRVEFYVETDHGDVVVGTVKLTERFNDRAALAAALKGTAA